MRTEDGLWHYHSCGHCSCYGPLDNLVLGEGRTLEELLQSCTKELREELKHLESAIRRTLARRGIKA
jgi:hypothetical protein